MSELPETSSDPTIEWVKRLASHEESGWDAAELQKMQSSFERIARRRHIRDKYFREKYVGPVAVGSLVVGVVCTGVILGLPGGSMVELPAAPYPVAPAGAGVDYRSEAVRAELQLPRSLVDNFAICPADLQNEATHLSPAETKLYNDAAGAQLQVEIVAATCSGVESPTSYGVALPDGKTIVQITRHDVLPNTTPDSAP